MTRTEMTALEALIGEFRDFRREDSKWKASIDERLRVTEDFVAGETAIEERDQARGVGRRAYLASAIAAIGVIASIVLGIVNFLS